METKYKIYKLLMANKDKKYFAHDIAKLFKTNNLYTYNLLLKLTRDYKNIKCKKLNNTIAFYYEKGDE